MSFAIESPPRRIECLSPGSPRVLLVTQASGGGVGRHFLDMAQALTARGVIVTGIYAPRKLDAQFRQRLAAGGLPPMHELPMRRAVHPLDAVDLLRLVQLIRRLGPFDLIHGHSSKGGALARLAARRLGIPSVYTPHAIVTLDPTLSAWKRSFYGRIERWLAGRTGAIIAVSDDEDRHIRTLGVDAGKIHVVRNGIEQPDFPNRDEIRTRLGIAPSAVVIGFVGRLTHQKAPEVLLEAFAAALPQRPGIHLVMVGGGPLEAEVRRRVEQLGLIPFVSLLGDVAAVPIMPAFDIFCLSSRYEAMPYVYLEAIAAGLPIVSTRVGGATTCVEPERNGLLVPPDDAGALSAALASLIDDRSLRQRFAVASAEMASRFTADQMVDHTLNVYMRVLAGKEKQVVQQGHGA